MSESTLRRRGEYDALADLGQHPKQVIDGEEGYGRVLRRRHESARRVRFDSDEPGRAPLPKDEYPALQEAFGGKLRVAGWDAPGSDGKAIQAAIAELDRLPKQFIAGITEAGLHQFDIIAGGVGNHPDFFDIRDTHMPRWPEETTLLQVPGIYDTRTKHAVVGSFGSGNLSVSIHEIAHVASDLFGYSADARLVAALENAPEGVRRRYGNGSRGRHEFIADGIDALMHNRSDALQQFGHRFVKFADDVIMKLGKARKG